MTKKAITLLDFQSILRGGGMSVSSIPFIYDVLNNIASIRYWRKAESGETTRYIAVFDRLISKERYDIDTAYKNSLRLLIQDEYLDASAVVASIIGAFGVGYAMAGISESADVIASNVVSAGFLDTYEQINVVTSDIKLLQLLSFSDKVDIFYFNNELIEKPTGFTTTQSAPIIPFYLAIKGYPYDTMAGLDIHYDEIMKYALQGYNVDMTKEGFEEFISEMYASSYTKLERDDFKRLYTSNVAKMRLGTKEHVKIERSSPDIGTVWKWCQYQTFLMAQENEGAEIDKFSFDDAKRLFKFFSGVTV